MKSNVKKILKDLIKLSEKRPPDKYHFYKVDIESNVFFNIVAGIIITGAPFIVVKYVILKCMVTKIWITGSPGDTVTDDCIS